MKNYFISGSLFFCVLIVFCLISCRTVQPEAKQESSIRLTDSGVRTQQQLVDFFMKNNPDASLQKVTAMAGFYISECKTEGINHDVAFIQMCLETGFLRFGGLVTEDMNNFCGLGAIDAKQRGLVLPTVELGVRAHVQHLHAYGSTSTLINECIDPRYKYVKPRGKAPTVYELAGTWAADKAYGEKLFNLLQKCSEFNEI